MRKAAGDDFGRARRQQRVILAVLDRVVGFDMLPTLIGRAPALYQELANEVRTDLSLDQMISLGWLAVQIQKANIRSGVIGPPNMVRFLHTSGWGRSAAPSAGSIRLLRDEIFHRHQWFRALRRLDPPVAP